MNQPDLISRRPGPGFRAWVRVMSGLGVKRFQVLAGDLTGLHCPLPDLAGPALDDLADALWLRWKPWQR